MRSLLREVNIDRALATTGFVSVFVALLVIARTPPATGYELSIYYAYPAHFWLLFIASSACGIAILIRQAFAAQKSSWWLAGLCLVILSNSVFLGLPFFRGYAFFPGGDAMNHVGRMKDIVATGHIGEENFYPLIHVLGVNLLDIAGLSYAAVTNFLFVFFTMMYLLNIYLLSTVVANHRGQALLITAFASPLVFSHLHTLVHPATMSIFMVPLLLYFYHRRQKIPAGQVISTILSLLLALVITFFHPITAIFAVGGLLTINLSRVLSRRIARHKELRPQGSTVTARDYTIPIAGLIAFLIWHLPHPVIVGRLRSVRYFLLNGTHTPLFTKQVEMLAMAGLSTAQAIELFIARYGAIFLYGIIAGIAVLVAIRMSLGRKAQPEPSHFAYTALFIFAVAFSALSLFGYTGEYDPERISRFFLMVAPVVSGLVFYDLIARQNPSGSGVFGRGRRAAIGLITVLILAAGVLGTFNVYQSPWVVQRNLDVSQMEISGTAWFSNHHDRRIVGAMRWPTHLEDLEDFNFGLESRPFPRAKLDPEPIPSHFGYDENSSIAETFDFQDRYLLICQWAIVFPTVLPENVRHKVPHYTEEDFARLRADPAAAQIYANREFVVWRVYGE